MLDFTVKLKAGNSVRIIDEETLEGFVDGFLDDKIYTTDTITDGMLEPLPYGTIYVIDVEASGKTEAKQKDLFEGIFKNNP